MSSERPTAEWEHVLEPEDRFWLWYEVHRSPLRTFRVYAEVSLHAYRRAQSDGYDTPDMTIPLDPYWWKTSRPPGSGRAWISRGGRITRYGETP